MSSVYDHIKSLLDVHKVSYQEFDHDPILSYEDAEKEKNKFGWKGVESKNVFMKGNNGKYYLFVTVQGEKVDFKKLKEVLDVKLSIASPEDVQNVIQCVPGCVSPFGFSEEITVIVDPKIFQYTDYLFSPGVTTKTMHANMQDMRPLFESLPNPTVFLAA